MTVSKRMFCKYECQRTSCGSDAPSLVLILCDFGQFLPNLYAPVRVKGAWNRKNERFHFRIFLQIVDQPDSAIERPI